LDLIQSLSLGAPRTFPGFTFTHPLPLLDPATNTTTTTGQPGTLTDVIDVNTAPLSGQNFNLDDLLTIPAVGAETELPTATASASKSQPIQIDYSQFSATPDFQAAGSIWTSGPSFTTDFNTFLGLDRSFGPKTLGTI